MRLTTKGRFAVTAMIDLGLRQSNGPVTLAAISQRQQISLSYLEQSSANCAATSWWSPREAPVAVTHWPAKRRTLPSRTSSCR